MFDPTIINIIELATAIILFLVAVMKLSHQFEIIVQRTNFKDEGPAVVIVIRKRAV